MSGDASERGGRPRGAGRIKGAVTMGEGWDGSMGQLAVVAALVERRGGTGDHEVFLARRAPGAGHEGLWELPGGKIEPGETPEEALVREIREELGVGIEILGEPRRYDSTLAGRDAVFLVFPSRFAGQPGAREAHDELAFFPLSALKDLRLAPLDGPALEEIAEAHRSRTSTNALGSGRLT